MNAETSSEVEIPAASEPGIADVGGAGRPTWSDRFTRHRHRYAYSGMVIALLLLWFSVTPSLLPRGPLFQGIVSGASAAMGYGIGVFGAWLAGYMMSRTDPWPSPGRRWWTCLGGVAVIGTAAMLYWFSRWQNEIRDLMGVEHLSWTAYPVTAAVALVVFGVLMSLGQAWGRSVSWLVGKLNRIAPPRISATIAATLVMALTVFILNGVVARYSMQWLNSSFAAANDETVADSAPPTSSLRSGGPDSLVTWDSLGREGRLFVSSGPSTEQLTAFNGRQALAPIRVFAGLKSAPTIRRTAELAARELERAGGLRRSTIAIGSTTGSGWLNKATVDSLEYMTDGDVATVSMQYSYLPSWLSFLVDRERARQAGRALFEAVWERVSAIGEAERPRIVVFGESLGSFAGESAFGTIPSIAARTDGAFFVGPTFSNGLWQDATRDRDPGSPQRLPVYENGRQARFVADTADLGRPRTAWGDSRIVYLQHASDPITWWSPDLALTKPDWLREERGADVVGSTRWIPLVTFLQVSADMAVSVGVPDGHGHNYRAAIPYIWAEILRPPGWDDAKTQALVPLLSRD
ncbi:hypothetical protein GS4_26_00960 [Gordonia soli NBRC 108243]|uniref:Alpha/beta-hydrolase catalytic domain-containing protein n=1 Tax=Gordonia soli NBRC 108243 TaxID=1223545 RepID=M0QM41_9ACTN|nr:hypothetical protein GS4_26_00960 [Gordonia soli NBRC 108243]